MQFFFSFGGRRWGSGGSILGDLGVKILKITDNQNVLGKVGAGEGRSSASAFRGSVLGHRLSSPN